MAARPPAALRLSRARSATARARPATARAQAPWIAAMEPWRGLGYRTAALATWLGRMARQHDVWVARATPAGDVCAVAVVQGDFLLGAFVSLLAVRPERAGQGLGRALVQQIETDVFARRRWLYTSCDSSNRAARRFYARLGFAQVGVLPDLIQPGRRELLLRKGR